MLLKEQRRIRAALGRGMELLERRTRGEAAEQPEPALEGRASPHPACSLLLSARLCLSLSFLPSALSTAHRCPLDWSLYDLPLPGPSSSDRLLLHFLVYVFSSKHDSFSSSFQARLYMSQVSENPTQRALLSNQSCAGVSESRIFHMEKEFPRRGRCLGSYLETCPSPLYFY